MSHLVRISDCCNPCGDSTSTTPVPGPPGENGTNGTNGTDGVNAYTALTALFVMPAEGATVVAAVADSTWATVGQVVYVEFAGYMAVTAKPTSTSITLRNLENTGSSLYTGNAAPGVVIPSGADISPAGIQGPVGPTSSVTLNDISPTTAKGSIIVDDGANAPAASDISLAVGTDGQALIATSGAATGLQWKTIAPNTVTLDNTIPRFDGTTGSPVPIQASFLVVTDDGAIQSTGSGGNARGQYSVDLQVLRGSATEVASGVTSVIGGGVNNTASGPSTTVGGGSGNAATGDVSAVHGGSGNVASGAYTFIGGGSGNTASADNAVIGGGGTNQATAAGSVIGGGDSNTASGTYATVGGGNGNTASGIDSVAIGGLTNTASNLYSVVSGGGTNVASGAAAVVCGGYANTASGNDSAVIGGTGCTASALGSAVLGGVGAKADIEGQVTQGTNFFAAAGDRQTSQLIAGIATTDATPTVLLYGQLGKATLRTNTSWTFQGLVVGRRDNADTAGWRFEGIIHNNAGVTGLVGAVTAVLIGADAGCAASWGVAGSINVTADNANDCLQIAVTGTAANNIRWVATVRIVEVSY